MSPAVGNVFLVERESLPVWESSTCNGHRNDGGRVAYNTNAFHTTASLGLDHLADVYTDDSIVLPVYAYSLIIGDEYTDNLWNRRISAPPEW